MANREITELVGRFEQIYRDAKQLSEKRNVMQQHNPPHPGAVLKDALDNLPMTVSEFAAHIGVARVTLSRILNERAAITPEMSIRLAEAFGQPTKDIWFKMQNAYDFWNVSQAKRKPVQQLNWQRKQEFQTAVRS